jgi:hypothetical protein
VKALLAYTLLGLGCVSNAPGGASSGNAALFNGKDLDGWRQLGDARWLVEDGAILGETGGGSQSFLVTTREFADFTLELEFRSEAKGNSGVQIRSAVGPAGRVAGYQIEVDSSERSWTGGLYDEAGRGWLQDLSRNEAARRAFRAGQWNQLRIEARGVRIRSWLNGVPAADYEDHAREAESAGFIALQVHSGQDTRVRWRNLRIVEHAR